MSDNIQIHGLEELTKALKKLPERIESNVLAAGVRAGAQVVRKAAIANLGGDKKDIVVKKSRSPRGTAKYKVGLSKDKWYLMFREFGTKPHLIKTKKKKVLAGGGEVFGPVIHHPGQAAKPFLRPALDENVPKIIKAMGAKMGKAIEKEAKKLKR